jgi:hypothetical protein
MDFKFLWAYGNIQALRMAENEERVGLFIYRKLSLCIVIFKFLGVAGLCVPGDREDWKVRCK